MSAPDKQMIERVLPEARHWNGHGKYGPALCMDECTLHIMSRGFGAKDGDGYLTHDPTKCDWERDEDGGEYVVVPLSNSDLLFLRDQLNALFPPALSAITPPNGDEVREARVQFQAVRAILEGVARQTSVQRTMRAKVDAYGDAVNEALKIARAALAKEKRG